MVVQQQSAVGRSFVENLELNNTAILLDVDGTLLNIASLPHLVTVDPALERTLARLLLLTGGALALVSGRKISDLDRLFTPLVLPAIGVHGAELRLGGTGSTIQRYSDPIDAELRARLAKLTEIDPGIVVEDKVFSIAVHYRLAPQRARMLQDLIGAICAEFPLAVVEILPGREVIEVKRPAFDKGRAVRELMRHSPFRGRRPVFIGDDVTDEFAFAIMPEFDGLGFSVGRVIPGLAGSFETPAEVRRWLYRLAARSEHPKYDRS
ncbi:MAG: trehalose-phosphatase [Rhizobiales bacterium]|nr:trehalose-phosphatase [Hyphomicrobiales bacterium]